MTESILTTRRGRRRDPAPQPSRRHELARRRYRARDPRRRRRHSAADPAVRVMVLGGEGRVFSAGGDFNWVLTWPGLDAITRHVGADALMAAVQAIYDFPKPSIARVHGDTVGGGIGLMLACDFAVATSQARFGLTSVRNGLLAGIAIPDADRGGGPARGAPAPDARRPVRRGDRAAHRTGRPGRRGRRTRCHGRSAGPGAEARRAVGADAGQEAGDPDQRLAARCRTRPKSWASRSPINASAKRRSKA